MPKVKYRFQSIDENNDVVGNKDKIYECELKEDKQPNVINCVESSLFTVLKDEIKSPLAVRDILMEAEQLALKCTHFEIIEVLE